MGRRSGPYVTDAQSMVSDTQVEYNGVYMFLCRLSEPILLQMLPMSPSMFYKCIGASDRIFDHCFCLSSAATTPFSLVPIGSPALLMRTHALSSNLTTLPSGRCHFFAVRT